LLAAAIGVGPLPPQLEHKGGLHDLAENMNRRHRSAQLAGRASVRINPYLSTASTYTSSMSCENQSLNKRRRCGEAPSSHDPRLLGATIAGAQVAAQSPAVEHESFESEYRAAGVVAACRVALLESPRACRSALAKYGSSIDSALARALRIGGSCKINEVVSSE